MSTFTWTDEVVKMVVETYTSAVDAEVDYAGRSQVVAELAKELEVSVPAVRGKLVAEGVYVAKEKASADADTTSKEAYAKALSAIVGTELKSATNMTKRDLEAVVKYITTASNQADADAGK